MVVGPGGSSGGTASPYGSTGGGGGSGGAVFGTSSLTGTLTATVGTSTGPYYVQGTNSSLVSTGFTRTAYAGGNGGLRQGNTNSAGYDGYAGLGGAQGDGSTSVGGSLGAGSLYGAAGTGGNGTFSGGGGGGAGGNTTGGYPNGGAGGAGGQRNWTASSWNNIGSTWGAGKAAGTSDTGGTQGIVAIQYPDTYPAATSTTGSPSIVVTGGYRVYTWTSSGSITF